MLVPQWFTKLMQNESQDKEHSRKRSQWIVDERKCLIENEIQALLKVADKIKNLGIMERRFSLIRKWFRVELGLHSGLRVGEMASLKHCNLLIEEGRASIVLYGKGNKKRSVLISQEFKATCLDYIDCKRSFGYLTEDKEPLLINLSGEDISKRALQKDFKEVLKIAKLSSHYYIHCLRHTYTTFLLLASNYNYRFVQKQLGHASIRTTQVYAGVLETEGKQALERLYVKLS